MDPFGWHPKAAPPGLVVLACIVRLGSAKRKLNEKWEYTENHFVNKHGPPNQHQGLRFLQNSWVLAPTWHTVTLRTVQLHMLGCRRPCGRRAQLPLVVKLRSWLSCFPGFWWICLFREAALCKYQGWVRFSQQALAASLRWRGALLRRSPSAGCSVVGPRQLATQCGVLLCSSDFLPTLNQHRCTAA